MRVAARRGVGEGKFSRCRLSNDARTSGAQRGDHGGILSGGPRITARITSIACRQSLDVDNVFDPDAQPARLPCCRLLAGGFANETNALIYGSHICAFSITSAQGRAVFTPRLWRRQSSDRAKSLPPIRMPYDPRDFAVALAERDSACRHCYHAPPISYLRARGARILLKPRVARAPNVHDTPWKYTTTVAAPK